MSIGPTSPTVVFRVERIESQSCLPRSYDADDLMSNRANINVNLVLARAAEML